MNLAILISGRGSNMQAIHRAIQEGRLNARLALILSDTPSAAGLDYARLHSVPTEVVERTKGETREAHDRRVLEKLRAHGVDFIALAGYMRLLSSEFIRAFSGRIVNIHPSLLPAFPGLHAQRQALNAGEKYAGCTVHFVDEGCDTGPIIEQRVVPVLPDDTEETLSARILEQEHQLYPACLQLIAQGKVKAP